MNLAGYKPHRLHLVSLDLVIIFLQLVLVTVAYETSFAHTAGNTQVQDMLTPSTDAAGPTTPTPRRAPLSSPQPSDTNADTSPLLSPEEDKGKPSPYVLDLTLRAVLARLRNPPPPPQEQDGNLPLPNTSAHAEVPRTIEWLLQRRLRQAPQRRARRAEAGAGNEEGQGQRLDVPGGLNG